MSGKPLFFAVILLIIVGLSDQTDEESLPNRPRVVVGKKTYYVETFLKANWYRASQFCRYHGMHLASVTSEEEHIKLVDEFIAIGNITGYWTSGNDLAKPQSFVWSSTGESFTYKNWQKNEPDNTVWAMDGVEHCVEMDNTNEEDTEQPQSSTSPMDSSSSTTTEKSETTEASSSGSEISESTTETSSNGTSEESTTTVATTTQATTNKDKNPGNVRNRVHIFVSKKRKNKKIDKANQSQIEDHNTDVTNDGNTTTTAVTTTEPPNTTAPTESPDTDVTNDGSTTTTELPSSTELTTEDNKNIPDIRKKNMYKWKDSLCTQTRYFVCEIQNK